MGKDINLRDHHIILLNDMMKKMIIILLHNQTIIIYINEVYFRISLSYSRF